MRILITGFIAFVIWGIFSAWMYTDKLSPVLKPREPVMVTTEKSNVADSLAADRELAPQKFSIYFDFNKSEFTNDQQTESSISGFREWLERHPGSMLNITGHTDIVGTTEYNNELGMKRASTVGKYMESKGIPADRMIVESKGESEPASDYLTNEGRAKDRRTEISIKTE
jgi:outer membrane protein OmpA-like peptidoglycan-associated protein